MSNRMERFTQRARHVLSLAQEEANRLRHHQIGTEHLLLGLMREEVGIAGRVLRDLGLDLRRVEELVKRLSTAGERSANSQLDLSPGTRRTLELAVNEARRLGHRYIGSEHLLLGLARLPDGVAMEILRLLGIDADQIRQGVHNVVQEPAAVSARTRESPPARQPAPGNPEFLLQRISYVSGRIFHYPVELSPSLKNALELALQEIGLAQSFVLDDRHILLGLLKNPDSFVSRALRDMGIDRRELTRILRHSS